MNLIEWAIKHGVNQGALAELRAEMGIGSCVPLATLIVDRSEAHVQSQVRLEAARKGFKLWRNNVGVLLDATGRPVRYGLANDSKQLNETVKSGDLIGWRPVTITPLMVGHRIAQFVSRECKAPGWSYKGDDHEKAQLRWIEAILADGGDAKFCNTEGTL